MKAKSAGVVFPSIGSTEYNKIGVLAGYNAEVFKHSIHIPQHADNYGEFALAIQKSEDTFKKKIKSLLFDTGI